MIIIIIIIIIIAYLQLLSKIFQIFLKSFMRDPNVYEPFTILKKLIKIKYVETHLSWILSDFKASLSKSTGHPLR